MTAADLRAVEAATSDSQLAALMAVQRERFALAQRPIIADPLQVDPAPFAHEEWRRRKHETRVWQRARRVQLRTEVAGYAQAVAAERYTQACQQQRVQQSQADRWWQALNAGDPSVLTAALAAAFADNPAPVEIIRAGGDASVLRVWLPGIEVLPERRAAVTPTGRRSTKAWTKTDRNEVYATVLGAHLLATAREAWAVAPSLARMQIGGMRRLPDGSMELLFDVAVSRSQGRWSDDDWGTHVLANVPRGLNRVGRTQEVRAWPAA